MRISALDSNKCKVALAHKKIILENSIGDTLKPVNPSKTHSFDKDTKMVCRINRKQTYLTNNEKDELVVKYQSGMTMMALANEYGCHYTTIGRVLRNRMITIRPRKG
jgi:hypothetical protein